MMRRSGLRIAVGICVHNEEDYITYCLRAIYDFADTIVVSVNTGRPWSGNTEPLDATLDLVRSFADPERKIVIRSGEWASEIEQRQDSLDLVRDTSDYYMIVDADEIYHATDLARIKLFVAHRPYVGQFRIGMVTYWKTNPIWKIDPPEPLRAHIISRVGRRTRFVDLRKTNELWKCTIPQRVAVCHHFSYARPSERIRRKISNFSHRHEVVPGWFENVWLRWDQDHDLCNLHPTHPEEYRRAVPVDPAQLPEVMRDHPFVRPI